MKRQNEKAPIIKPFFRPPGGNEKRAFRPPLTPPNLGGEEVTPKADGTDQENNLLTL